MEKISEAYRGVIVFFHGVVSAFVFITLSAVSVTDAQTFMLIAVFAAFNVLLFWVLSFIFMAFQAVVRWFIRWRRGSISVPLADVLRELGQRVSGIIDVATPLSLRQPQIAPLIILSVITGSVTAYGYREEFFFSAMRTLQRTVGLPVQRVSVQDPFLVLLRRLDQDGGRSLDLRNLGAIRPNANSHIVYMPYLRIFDSKSGFFYEGIPTLWPSKQGERQVVISRVCRARAHKDDRTTILQRHLVDGPSVYINLENVGSVETLDRSSSECDALWQARWFAQVTWP